VAAKRVISGQLTVIRKRKRERIHAASLAENAAQNGTRVSIID
jgi:hypothetical protein